MCIKQINEKLKNKIKIKVKNVHMPRRQKLECLLQKFGSRQTVLHRN